MVGWNGISRSASEAINELGFQITSGSLSSSYWFLKVVGNM